MNVFNRIVVVLLLIVSIPLLFIPIAIAISPVPVAQLLVMLADGIRNLNNVSFTARVPIVLISLLLLIIDIVLIWAELRQLEPVRTVRIKQVAGAEAEITTDSIANRLVYHIDQLPHVIRVTPHVIGAGKDRSAVEVLLEVETGPDVDVPAKTEEIVRLARQVLEQQMGLEVAHLRVNIRHSQFPRRRPAKATGAPAQATETAPTTPAPAVDPGIPAEQPDLEGSPADDESGMQMWAPEAQPDVAKEDLTISPDVTGVTEDLETPAESPTWLFTEEDSVEMKPASEEGAVQEAPTSDEDEENHRHSDT